jgi:drug/metabolite transporter (DMT)-like permease
MGKEVLEREHRRGPGMLPRFLYRIGRRHNRAAGGDLAWAGAVAYKAAMPADNTRAAPAAFGVRFALPILLLGALAIGFSGIFVRLAEVGPIASAFYRAGFAVPMFALWLAFAPPPAAAPAARLGRRDYATLFLAGLFFAGDLACWHWSLLLTTIANSTLFANFTPVFVTLAAWLLFGQTVTRAFLLGLATALAGAFVLMGGSVSLGGGHLLGDALGLVTAVFYSGYLLTVARLRRRLSAPVIMGWSSAATALVLLPAALIAGDRILALTAGGWALLVLFAFVSQVAGQGMIAQALAHLPASFSSVGLLIQPVAAALYAWVLLDEAVGPLQALGGAIVLAGIFIAHRASRR